MAYLCYNDSMIENPFTSLIAKGLIGMMVIVGGVSFCANEIINQAKFVVSQVNTHELAIALELYHTDYQTYPEVENGDVITVLTQKGYIIRNAPNPAFVHYEALDDGNNYRLSLDHSEYYTGCTSNCDQGLQQLEASQIAVQQ